MIGTMANGHLEIRRIWSKRTLGANGHLRQMGTEQMAKKHSEEMGIEINGDLGQIGCWKKLIGLNGHLEKWAPGKWAFGGKG